MIKKNEYKDLFNALNLTYEKYSSSQMEEKTLLKKMQEEISKTEREIKLAYQERINLSKNNCRDSKKEWEHYKKQLENYSTFDSKMIGNILEKLVSLVEGEDYSFQKASHDTYEYESTVFGSECFKVNKKLLMIVKGNQKQEHYYDYSAEENEVEELIEKHNAILLADNIYSYDKRIRFYTVNDGSVRSLIDFNNFSYIKEFIDIVVQYRFDNSLDKITEIELLELMRQFVLDKKELIEDKYKKRAKEKQEMLTKQLLEKQEKLNKQLLDEQLRREEEMEKIELENLIENGVPSKNDNTLIERLREDMCNNQDFITALGQYEVLYEGEKQIATIKFIEPLISYENIFISKINIESSIKDYFDVSDPDPHFHGFCDIDIVDDGLVGIVDISNLQQNLDDVLRTLSYNQLYTIDKINDQYLRFLYLPNSGKYAHKPINIYGWIISLMGDEPNDNHDKQPISYKIEWNCIEETEKMLSYLKEFELLSNLTEKQLKLYKQRKK